MDYVVRTVEAMKTFCLILFLCLPTIGFSLNREFGKAIIICNKDKVKEVSSTDQKYVNFIRGEEILVAISLNDKRMLKKLVALSDYCSDFKKNKSEIIQLIKIYQNTKGEWEGTTQDRIVIHSANLAKDSSFWLEERQGIGFRDCLQYSSDLVGSYFYYKEIVKKYCEKKYSSSGMYFRKIPNEYLKVLFKTLDSKKLLEELHRKENLKLFQFDKATLKSDKDTYPNSLNGNTYKGLKECRFWSSKERGEILFWKSKYRNYCKGSKIDSIKFKAFLRENNLLYFLYFKVEELFG